MTISHSIFSFTGLKVKYRQSLVFISETLHLRNAKLLINLGSIDLVKLGCFVTKVSNVSS
jgi:hypothetical protein